MFTTQIAAPPDAASFIQEPVLTRLTRLMSRERETKLRHQSHAAHWANGSKKGEPSARVDPVLIVPRWAQILLKTTVRAWHQLFLSGQSFRGDACNKGEDLKERLVQVNLPPDRENYKPISNQGNKDVLLMVATVGFWQCNCKSKFLGVVQCYFSSAFTHQKKNASQQYWTENRKGILKIFIRHRNSDQFPPVFIRAVTPFSFLFLRY